jgi:DNA-binding Xre family transcriptional regulator
MMTDTFELEKQIKMNGFTKKALAEMLGISVQALDSKIKNLTEFKASEIEKICVALHLPNRDIFFCKNVELNSHF